MYNKEALEYTMTELFRICANDFGGGREGAEDLLEGIDYDALQQSLKHQEQTVYAFTTDGESDTSYNYRSSDLFGQKAIQLYIDLDSSRDEGDVNTQRSLELWLLEDLTLTVTVCVSVSVNDDAYVAEYREIKGNIRNSGIYISLGVLADNIYELCASYFEGEQPVYEL